jgi:hypothetical protein
VLALAQQRIERSQSLLPVLAEYLEPNLDFRQWAGIEMIISLSPAGLFTNQPCLSEHLKVLGDSWATDRETSSQFVCSTWPTAQPNEDLPPNWIRES